jgi:UDPglucose 6-dehydrogenase
LLAEGCSIAAYDPAAMERTERELPPSAQLRYAEDAYAAAEDADALLILTDWAEFAKLDLRRLHDKMRYPIVVDGRNLYEPKVMQDKGFTYISIGRPTANPTRESDLVGSTSE